MKKNTKTITITSCALLLAGSFLLSGCVFDPSNNIPPDVYGPPSDIATGITDEVETKELISVERLKELYPEEASFYDRATLEQFIKDYELDEASAHSLHLPRLLNEYREVSTYDPETRDPIQVDGELD